MDHQLNSCQVDDTIMNDNMRVGIESAESAPSMGTAINGPRSLFVWWELPESRRAHIENSMGGPVKWCLRVTGQPSGDQKTVNVEPEPENYYLELSPETTYEIELGWYAAGEFHGVCGPVEAEMPAEKPAEKGEPDWVNLKAGGEAEKEQGLTTDQLKKAEQPPGLEWDENLVETGSSGLLSSSEMADEPEEPEEAESAAADNPELNKK